MRINCPHCGDRDQGEFTYLGDAGVRRPSPRGGQDEALAYVYLRDNPAGEHRELWYHGFGCRAWIEVVRDTRTHAISAVTACAPVDAGKAP